MEKIDLKHLAYTLHLWLEKERKNEQGGRELIVDTLVENGYDEKFAFLISLGGQWMNDIAWWVEQQFGIETQSSNFNGWYIDDKKYEAMSDEFYNDLDKLITERYEEHKNEKMGN